MTAMPSSRRLVERSAAICRQQGMSDVEAYQFVAHTARHVTSYLEVHGFRDLGWLREVEEVALSRAISARSDRR